MQQLTQVFWAVVLVTSLLSTAEAKRGCASYGHSCFGGHGKRSGPMPIMRDCSDENSSNNPDCPPKPEMYRKYNNINQEIAYPTTNQLGPNRYDIAQSILEQREMQYAMYNIIRQMVENARKARESADSRIDDNQQV